MQFSSPATAAPAQATGYYLAVSGVEFKPGMAYSPEQIQRMQKAVAPPVMHGSIDDEQKAQPVDDLFAVGKLWLVTANETNILGCKWQFEDYESFVTIYRNRWLGALLPRGRRPELVTK